MGAQQAYSDSEPEAGIGLLGADVQAVLRTDQGLLDGHEQCPGHTQRIIPFEFEDVNQLALLLM